MQMYESYERGDDYDESSMARNNLFSKFGLYESVPLVFCGCNMAVHESVVLRESLRVLVIPNSSIRCHQPKFACRSMLQFPSFPTL